MTGSILPSFAIAVKSLPNCSTVGVDDFLFELADGALPLGDVLTFFVISFIISFEDTPSCERTVIAKQLSSFAIAMSKCSVPT